MTRIPASISVASLNTHRLIIAVPNTGPADVASNLPRSVAATVLRQLADQLDGPAGRCETSLITGRPCPVHDAPSKRPANPEPGPAPTPDGDLTADTVRDALAFNTDDRDQVLATLRDILLDTSLSRTPAQALATARILLDAHAHQLAALIEAERTEIHTRWGLKGSSRAMLTGYSNARRTIRAYAARLADDQALAEAAEHDQATQ